MIFWSLLTTVIGYLLGSVNSSIIISKYFFGTDIRTFGSGNAGATNTLRTLGVGAAIMVVLGDILKGMISVLIGGFLAGNFGMLIGGLSSILGHNWPIYFDFKGGKGILTSLAVILTIDWRIGLVLALIGIGIIAITRFVSLGSISGCVLLPVAVWIMPNFRGIEKIKFFIFSLILSIIAIVRHRENIKRLINRTETRIGQKSNNK